VQGPVLPAVNLQDEHVVRIVVDGEAAFATRCEIGVRLDRSGQRDRQITTEFLQSLVLLMQELQDDRCASPVLSKDVLKNDGMATVAGKAGERNLASIPYQSDERRADAVAA